MIRGILIALAAIVGLATTALSQTRTYRGTPYGSVAGIVQSATVEIQIDGTPSAGVTNRARARLISDPGAYPVSQKWSRWHTAAIGGKPANFDVDIPGLKGRLGVDWSDDLSNIVVQARGTASVFDLVIEPTTFVQTAIEVKSNAPPVMLENEILKRVYKKGSLIGFDANVPSSWPRVTKEGKTMNAIACINGRKFDFVRVGQSEKTLANPYTHEYFQPIRKGDVIEFSLTDLNKRNETRRLPIVWQWEPTVK